MNQQEINALGKLHYMKKDFKKSFLFTQEAINEKLVTMNFDLDKHYQYLKQRHGYSDGPYKFLSNYLRDDQTFLFLPLQPHTNILKDIIKNDKIYVNKQKKLFELVDSQLTKCLFRDRHLIIRKKCVILNYFGMDYEQVVQEYLQQSRVQLKYYIQTYKFLVDFLGKKQEEGIQLYRKFIYDNPSNVEGYDCIDELLSTEERIELWQQFIINNPYDRVGYLRLIAMPNTNQVQILKQFNENNPNDYFGYTQLCFQNQSEKFFDEYLISHPDSWEAHNQKCHIIYTLRNVFEPQILADFFLKCTNKYNVIEKMLLNLEQKINQNSVLTGYKAELLKFLLQYVCKKDQVIPPKIIEQKQLILECIAQIYKETYNIEKMNADIDAHRNEIQYFITKANYYQQINQTEQAFIVFDEYITLNPTQFDGYDEKAKFMKYKCKPILIKQHWEKFVQSSDSSNLLKKAEIASIILKKHDQALSLIEKYIDMNPLEEQGHLVKIKHLQNIGKQKETLKAIDVYLDINPTNEQILAQKALLLSKVYSNQVALQFIDSVKECFKLLTLKSRLLGEDSKEKGLALIDQYLQKNPEDRKCQKFRIIFIRDYFGQKYLDHLRILVKQDPHNWRNIKFFYKLTFEDHNFFDEARDLIDQYIESHPSEWENHKKLVNLLSK